MSPNDLAVQAITTTALPSCTYNNGTAGVGATLTASSNGAFPGSCLDNYTPGLNDALAVGNQSTSTQNGLYTLTTVGDGSNPWVLTRRSPDDANIWTNPFCVLNGTKYANTVWCSQTIDSNVGTDSISFVQQVATLNRLYDCINTNAGGNGSIYIGSGSGNQNTPCIENVGIGGNVLVSMAANGLMQGQNNVAIGYDSMTLATYGILNVAIGNESANKLTTGGHNVLIGNTVATTLTTGSDNIIIGDSRDVTGATVSHTLNIGDVITATGMDTPSTSAVALPGALTVTGNITGPTQTTGDNSTKVATTAFVQTAIGAITAGLDSRPSCRVATTAALTATYSNGSSGVGATLTNSGTKSAISIDGVSLSANDRVLVKNQATAAQNGIYTVTTVGSGSVNWVLTRSTDFNTASGTGVVEGAFTVIEEGTSNAGTFWIETGAGPFTIGTTAITFTQLQVTNVTDASIVFSDITTNNVSTSKHGFAPKAPNDATKYLDGTGAYSRPSVRTTSITSSSTPTPNADTTDNYTVTALATAPTFGAPTGSPLDGQRLSIRIKDNATPRALAWNAAYRAGTDVGLPTTTVASKTMYVGFMYNSADSKWDCIASVGNI